MARESVRVLGLEGVLAQLKQFPEEMGKNGGPVKLALRDAMKPLLDQAVANVRAITSTTNADGEDVSTGLLAENIRSKRSKPSNGKRGEAYVVGIRNKPYPPARQAKNQVTTTAQVGRLLEYGSERRSPMPWLRPAFDARKNDAVAVFVASVTKRTAALIKRIERKQNAAAKAGGR